MIREVKRLLIGTGAFVGCAVLAHFVLVPSISTNWGLLAHTLCFYLIGWSLERSVVLWTKEED
jgi:hypothetical protein